MILLSGTHLQATSKERKTKLNTDFDIPLTEEAVKKSKEDKRLHEVTVTIDSPREGPKGLLVEGPPGEGPPGQGPPADGPGEGPPAKGSASASVAEGPAAKGPAAKGPAGNIAKSFLKYKL